MDENLRQKQKDLLFILQSHQSKSDQTEKIIVPRTLIKDDFLKLETPKKEITIALDIPGIYDAKEIVDRSYFNVFRIATGMDITFILLALGLNLNFKNGIIYGRLFVACVFAGFSIPFLLFTREH